MAEASTAAIRSALKPCSRRSSSHYHCFSRLNGLQPVTYLAQGRAPLRIGAPTALIGLHSARGAVRVRLWRSKAATAARTVESPEQARATTVEIRITCYQVNFLFWRRVCGFTSCISSVSIGLLFSFSSFYSLSYD